MPYLNPASQRMRLCAWTCNKTTSPFASTRTAGYTASKPQRRILLTTTAPTQTESGSRPTLLQRSPHQWSHIAHHIRKPAILSARAAVSSNGVGSMASHARGHNHGGHHHHHDNTFLTSTNKSDPGVRITRIGLYVNLGMAIAKGAGGYIFNSQA